MRKPSETTRYTSPVTETKTDNDTFRRPSLSPTVPQ